MKTNKKIFAILILSIIFVGILYIIIIVNSLKVTTINWSLAFLLGAILGIIFMIIKNEIMKKKARLTYYRHIRKIRDELIRTENEGRQRRLIMEMPNTSNIYFISGEFSICEVELNDGYTIYHSGNNCLVECGKEVYMHWLKHSLKP